MAHDFPERLDRARRELTRLGWSGLLVAPGADLRYLTGYPAVALERLTCLVLRGTRRQFMSTLDV